MKVVMANDAIPEEQPPPPKPTLPAGYPAPPAAPARVYISVQGDWWDMIALRVYGGRRFDDHLMHKLIEANYPLRNVSLFPAGLTVVVPEVAKRTEVPLVPWKKVIIE